MEAGLTVFVEEIIILKIRGGIKTYLAELLVWKKKRKKERKQERIRYIERDIVRGRGRRRDCLL